MQSPEGQASLAIQLKSEDFADQCGQPCWDRSMGLPSGVEDAVPGFAIGRAFVDVGCRVESLASFAHGGDVFDFETEVIDAGLQLRPFSSSSGAVNRIIASARPSVFPKQDTVGIVSSAWI